MVDAVFALDGVAAAVVGSGLQAALDRFADVDVFLLNDVAEGDGPGGALEGLGRVCIVKETLENGERFVVREREDHVGLDVVTINIQHEIRENPEVERFF